MVNVIARYGVSEVTIYAWIKNLSPMELEDGSSVTPEDYNACIEYFHAILKKEEVKNHIRYIDEKSGRMALFQYIEGWYNRKRIHSSLGYKTPQ